MRLFWVSFKHYDQTKNEYKVCWIDKDKKGHCYCLVVKFLFSQYGVYSNIATAALKSYFTVGRLWKWKGSICFKASGTNLARALLFEMPFALRSSRAIALWTTWQNWPWVQHFDLWQQQSCHHPKCVMDRSKKKSCLENHDWSLANPLNFFGGMKHTCSCWQNAYRRINR